MLPAPSADLQLDLRFVVPGAAPGEALALELGVTNAGEGPAVPGRIQVQLPDTLLAADNPGWDSTSNPTGLYADLPALAPGQELTATLHFKAAGSAGDRPVVTVQVAAGELTAEGQAQAWIVASGRAWVDASGGLILAPGRTAWVHVPVAGTTRPVEAHVTTLADLPAPLDFYQGAAFTVSASGDLPARIALRLPAADLPTPGATRRTLALFRYDAAAGRWTRLPTTLTPHYDGSLRLTAATTAPGTFAAALSAQEALGDYTSPWQPTVSEAQVDLFTGAVSWRYPLAAPLGRGGMGADLALTYNSAVVDGRYGQVNPQSPGIGLGWSLATAYIERDTSNRDEHGTPQIPESLNSTFRIVFNGVSSDLVCIDGQAPCREYRTQSNHPWRIRRLDGAPNESDYGITDGLQGEYWQLTTPDGTAYRFGWSGDVERSDNEHQGSAWYMLAQQHWGLHKIVPYVWRWNLDRVEDPQGNVTSLIYARQFNDAGVCTPNFWNGVNVNPYEECWFAVGDLLDSMGHFDFAGLEEIPAAPFRSDYGDHVISGRGYVRGGHLARVVYTRGGGDGAYEVQMWTQRREEHYPTHFDAYDNPQARKVQTFPTFWNDSIVVSITVSGGLPRAPLWTYELSNTFGGGLAPLRLDSVQRVAADGSRLPATRFDYHQFAGYCIKPQGDGTCKPNTADEITEEGYKYWIAKIENGYGGETGFTYMAPLNWESVWETWQEGKTMDPRGISGKHGYRYRLRELKVSDGSGTVARTVYEYRHAVSGDLDPPPHNGTWDDHEFQGHPLVRVKRRDFSGAVVTVTDHYFHQGVDAQRKVAVCDHSVHDVEWLRGRSYQTIAYDATLHELQRSVTAYAVDDYAHDRHAVRHVATCAYPDGLGGPVSKQTFAYDDYGNLTRQVNYGDVSYRGDEVVVERGYVHNPTAWLVGQVMTESLRAQNGALQVQTRYAYDGQAHGQPPQKGLVTEMAQGRADWDWVTTQTHYDAWGNPDIITDALGFATHTVYDPVLHQYPVRVTNAQSHTTTTAWDVRLGVPTVITDTNGGVTRLQHDAFGRVTAVTRPGESVPAVTYTYPTGDAVSAPFAVQAQTRVDPYLSTPVYQRQWTIYDGLGRTIQTQTQSDAEQLVLQSTAYDDLGRPARASLPYTTTLPGGSHHPPDWTTLHAALTTYDLLGRPRQVRGADGSLTRKAYRGWDELALDAEGHQTVHARDGLGRTVAVHEYPGTYAAPDWEAADPHITRYTYDVRGNLTQVRDALGHRTRIGYDPLGRKTWMDDPSMGEWTYTYDDAGNLTTQTDAEGQMLTFEYDELHRLTHKYASSTLLLAEYGYDQGPHGIGQRTAMTDTTGVARWRYDALGQVRSETRTVTDLGTFTTAWGYDAAGRVRAVTHPTGETVVTTYNLRGLPSHVAGTDVYLDAATYTPAGQPAWQQWGNGRRTTYTYEPATLRLTRLELSGGLLDLHYTYDDVGNLTTLTDARNAGQVQTFTYDARDRLLTAETSAVGAAQYYESYRYDALGNILSRKVDGATVTYAYGRPPAPSQPVTLTLPHRTYLPMVALDHDPTLSTIDQPFAVVATSAGFRAAYDRNGNMTLRVEVSGTATITYVQAFDVENRLHAVTNTVTGDVTHFTYDGDGTRLLREHDGARVLYLGATEIAIAAGGERTVTTYYSAGGGRIAKREGAELVFLHGDHLGSASVATDASGARVGAMRYTPFGEARSGSIPTDRRYTGQRWDAAFGLYDYNARYYAPGLGRFISADTIVPEPGNPQSLNRYSYVVNNPLRYTDPSGNWWEDPVTGALMEGDAPSYLLERRTTLYSVGYRTTGITYLFKEFDLKSAANLYGVPWQVVASVLDSEIMLDTGLEDYAETALFKYGPHCLAELAVKIKSDPGPGIGNIHVSTARAVSKYFANHYPESSNMQLNLHEDSIVEISKKLADRNFNIEVATAYIRMLSDYRFGKDGKPLTIDRSNLETWTMTDGVSMWHGYRYGVQDISPGGQGFLLQDFQNRNSSFSQLVSVAQGIGARQSIESSLIMFSYYYNQ